MGDLIGLAETSNGLACIEFQTDLILFMLVILLEVRVEDSNQKCRFMVLPMRPEGTEGWSEAQLAEIVTRDCMIGIALPRPGRTADDIRPISKARRPVPHEAEAAE